MTQYPSPGHYPPGQVPPPQQLGYATPQPAVPWRADLRAIATRQRILMFCILAYIVCIVGQFALPQELRFVAGLAGVAASITASVFVFMLAIALYGTGTGVLYGVGTLIPCVGLIVLLVVNGKATAVLKAHGVHVGFLGADPNSIGAGPAVGGYPPAAPPPGGRPHF